MKIIDLVVLDFNLKLKDKTVFKVLNQIGHDKYIYNRKDRKFHDFEYETENENTTLVIDSETIAWEIEIIEEEKKIELPEKLEIEQDTPNSNYYIKNEFGTRCGLTKHSKMIADKLNETLDYLKYKEEESKKC